MYDVIPFRHPDIYRRDDIAVRLAALRAAQAGTVDLHMAISRWTSWP
jgi:hypothetical protein